MRRHVLLLCTLIPVALTTIPALAVTQGRIMAQVVDENGEPVEGVKITITTPDLTDYKDELETNKKGRFTAVFLDATKNYMFKFEKKGYRTLEEAVKPTPGDNRRVTFTMPSYQAEPAQETDQVPTGAAARGLTEAQKVFNEGVVASQEGDAEGALAKFTEAAEMDPELMQAHLAIANLYLIMDQPEKAGAEAERTLEIEPGEARALEIAYDAYSALGNQEKANEYLHQLQETGIDISTRLYNAGVSARNVGDYKTAAAKFRAALQEDPELTPAYSALAVVLVGLKQYDEALEAAEQALQRDPGNDRAHRMKYQALRLLGRLDEAAAAFHELKPEDQAQTIEVQYNDATDLYNAGQTQEAAKVLEGIVAAEPDNAKAHYLLGLSYTNLGDSAAARTHFERFIQLAPDDPDAATAQEMLKYLQSG
jgi:tetratricopeptide (TPR) repeat protein